ncbi:MAG: energy-coupling factor transporter transmembrane component T [Desulfobacterales bacterium]
MDRLDPRTRLVLLALAVTAVLLTRRAELLAAEALLLTAAVLIPHGGRVPVSRPGVMAAPIGIVLVIGLIFYDLRTALALTLRLFNLLAVSTLFLRGLKSNDLAGALRQAGLPHAPAFILTTALRYVPLMTGKITHIRAAQQARGIDLRPRLKNLPHLAALLVPLAVQSFILADDLALAMESRGFGRSGRSMSRHYRIRPGEYGLMAAGLGLVVLLGWWQHA